MTNILCSSTLKYGLEAFSKLGNTIIGNEQTIQTDDLSDIDILAVRSTRVIDSKLLNNTPVQFVGTATIGTDHFDSNYMTQNNITTCSAPGCNANSVSEYITAALLNLACLQNTSLEENTIGIIGHGNIGTLVENKAKTLGMSVLLNDPPKDALVPDNDYLSLDEMIPQCDIITMHVPLTQKKPFPTQHMVNNSFFEKMKKGTTFINCSRGAIMNSDAVIEAISNGTVTHAIIDTWEDEPSISKALLDQVDVATAHIAGHSLEGKAIGTEMVYLAACKFLNVKPSWTVNDDLPPAITPEIFLDADNMTDEEALNIIVSSIYDIRKDDHALRNNPGRFTEIRSQYPTRREFRYSKVIANNATENLLKKITGLGFSA